MKKQILFILCGLMFTSAAFAQFTVADEDGNTLQDGSVIVTNSLVRRTATWNFLVVNDNNFDIYVKAELVSTSGDPSQFEFCFGLCYSGISQNQELPPGAPLTIAARGDSGRGNHMLNMAPSNGVVYDYQMRFYQTDATGNTELGPEYFITYRFDENATLGIDEGQIEASSVLNTVIDNNMLNLDLNESTKVSIFDLQGRKVLSNQLEQGRRTINLQTLRSQAYLVVFEGTSGSNKTHKIIKR
ncbi:MAG: T9SS type A sorting domain-containing protein [Nonlabens sp.]